MNQMDRKSCLPFWLPAVLLVVAIIHFRSCTSDFEDTTTFPCPDPCDPQRPYILTQEQRLMRFLVGDYDSSVRPVFDASKAVDIKLGLALTQILDLDEKNQVLTVNVWLEAEWHDERLNWSAPEFGGISSIRVPCHKIWLPDIVLYNSVDDYTSGYMPSLAMVYNSSRVFWGPVIRFRSACNIDITYFPFDNQVCKLKMGSWAYNGLQVNVFNKSHTMDLSNFVDNGEWELLSINVKRNVVYYPCCLEPFPDVTFTIQLRRRTKYYFMNIIIPCIILSFLCLGGFLLPPESGEKITLGLSVLLTITVFMLMVADKMPQTSESISVISIYLMVVLATSCLSVLSSVLVLSIHHKRGRPGRAPAWLRWFCFKVMAKVFRFSRRPSFEDPQPTGKQTEDVEGHHYHHQFRSGVCKRKRNRCASLKKEFSDIGNSTAIGSTDEESEFLRMNSKEKFPNHEIPEDSGKELSQESSAATATHWRKTVGNNVHHHPSSKCRQHHPHFSCYREVETDTTFTVSGDAMDGYRTEHFMGGGLGVGFKERDVVDFSDKEGDTEDPERSNVNTQDSVDLDAQEKQREPPPRNKNAYKTYGVVIRQLVALIQTKQKDEMKDEEIFQEWHDVAYVLDRLLFVLFFVITLISTVCLLILRPVPEDIN